MFRKATVIIALSLSVFAFAQAEYYAVLITGDTPGYDAIGPKTWQTGSRPGPYDEFWSDTFVMWETLWKYGWKDEDIFVLFGFGVDWSSQFQTNPR